MTLSFKQFTLGAILSACFFQPQAWAVLSAANGAASACATTENRCEFAEYTNTLPASTTETNSDAWLDLVLPKPTDRFPVTALEPNEMNVQFHGVPEDFLEYAIHNIHKLYSPNPETPAPEQFEERMREIHKEHFNREDGEIRSGEQHAFIILAHRQYMLVAQEEGLDVKHQEFLAKQTDEFRNMLAVNPLFLLGNIPHSHHALDNPSQIVYSATQEDELSTCRILMNVLGESVVPQDPATTPPLVLAINMNNPILAQYVIQLHKDEGIPLDQAPPNKPNALMALAGHQFTDPDYQQNNIAILKAIADADPDAFKRMADKELLLKGAGTITTIRDMAKHDQLPGHKGINEVMRTLCDEVDRKIAAPHTPRVPVQFGDKGRGARY